MGGVTIPLPPPFPHLLPQDLPQDFPSPSQAQPCLSPTNPTRVNTPMEQRNPMTPKTEDSISLILCCFPAFKSCADAQRLCTGTKPGKVQMSGCQAHPCLQQPLPSAHLSLGQPWASPGVRAPTTASQGPAAEGSGRHCGCSAVKHPPAPFSWRASFLLPITRVPHPSCSL